ncbi:MAG: hypothetical protein ACKVP4_07935 [Hyphomicrobium sp.]
MTFELSSRSAASEWVHVGPIAFGRDEDITTHQQEGNAMAHTIDTRRRSLSKFKRAESLEFRLIFIAAFAVFLVTATLERLLLLSWLRGEGSRKSILEQAKESANTCAAYAFMG